MTVNPFETVRVIATKEWWLLARDGRIRLLTVVLMMLLLAAIASGWVSAKRWQADADAAAAQDRVTWLSQDARNPHSVAHFGQYAFKPAGALAFFDPGVSATLGSGIWMEAHYQNPATFRQADTGASRLGGLSAAWLLQLGMPLLILLAGFAAFAGEREAGTLRLQLLQGASWWRLLAGKALALTTLAAFLWLPIALALLILSADAARAITAMLAYGAYALVWVGLTLAVSGWAAQARSALAILLALWLGSTLLLPRVAADVAERIHPSPVAERFWADVGKAQREGIDGHNPSDTRTAKLLQDTLAHYGVQDEAALPVSFVGIALQASELDSNAIFDRFFGNLWAVYQRQHSTRLAFSALSPLPALQALSQRAASTDLGHHRHFVDAAEAHRRGLQHFLNGDITQHAKGVESDYRAPTELWARAPVWQYQAPLQAAGGSLTLSALILLAWVMASAGLAMLSARQLVRKGGR